MSTRTLGWLGSVCLVDGITYQLGVTGFEISIALLMLGIFVMRKLTA